MQGRDLIARAKTGTGKTLAFGIPIIHNIVIENEKNRMARCGEQCLHLELFFRHCNVIGRMKDDTSHLLQISFPIRRMCLLDCHVSCVCFEF